MLDTVTVACKLPNGMKLHTFDASGRKVEINVKGNRLPIHPKSGRELRTFEIAGADQEAASGMGGYGLTPGVDRATWERIAAESAETPPFKGGLIFALGDTASASDMARDADTEFVSGLEPINADKPGKDIERVSQD